MLIMLNPFWGRNTLLAEEMLIMFIIMLNHIGDSLGRSPVGFYIINIINIIPARSVVLFLTGGISRKEKMLNPFAFFPRVPILFNIISIINTSRERSISPGMDLTLLAWFTSPLPEPFCFHMRLTWLALFTFPPPQTCCFSLEKC